VLPSAGTFNFYEMSAREKESTKKETRPAWAGFKTAEEGRAKIMKFSI
jgi:hypothetical protein